MEIGIHVNTIYNPMIGFLKYEFNNKLLGGVIFLKLRHV